jgi:LysR family transcriptional regulator, transcriptional activator of the cysJI operon
MEFFRFAVFRSVAKHLSFTKAAKELFITQPAVSKNIHMLEKEYELRLFNRKGNRIYLTAEGVVLLKHADKLYNFQKEFEDEINYFKSKPSGSLQIGASTTIAQYVIPPVLPVFQKKFPEIILSLVTANTDQIADDLLRGKIDLGIVEGKIRNRDIHYIKFISDELVAVCRTHNMLIPDSEISLKDLSALPLILRERGSGTLDVVEHELKKKGINPSSLNVVMHLGSTEAIKLYLEHDDCIGFISRRAVQKELFSGSHKIVRIKNFQIKRTFDFITPQGLQPATIAARFIKIAKQFYNQK